ncbi:MAG: DUF4321 domain-containing protein [Firmicutes bacterium]|nr:DUF4321 domain-containing protein [Candidatus Fermentithermobacillaceae bacterium]
MRRNSRLWLLVLLLAAGAIVGSIIGEIVGGTWPNLAILARGFRVGVVPPFTLDLNVLTVTFGFSLHLNVLGGIVVLLLLLWLGR